MKKMFLAIAASLAILPVSAQSVFDNPENSICWGVRAALDINTPGKWNFNNGASVKMYNSKAGVHVGGIVNIPIVANLYVEPGAGLFYDTYRYSDISFSEDGGEQSIHNPLVQKFGVRIPVMVGYRFDFTDRASVSLFTGPEFSYSLWGQISYKSKSDFEKIMPKLFDEQYRANLSWNAGASLEWDYHWVFSVTGSFGLTDSNRSKNISFHENRVSVALGYNF